MNNATLLAVVSLGVLILAPLAWAQPAPAPASRPVVELGRWDLGMGATAVLTRQYSTLRIVDRSTGGARDIQKFGYILWKHDRDAAAKQADMLWRGDFPSIEGSSAERHDPAILDLQLQAEYFAVVYNQTGNCWGDVMRWRPGQEPERLLASRKVFGGTPGYGDFGAAAARATITGKFEDRSLIVTVTDNQGNAKRFAPDVTETGSRWSL